ncbi:cell number regulator 8-like [Salvia splendens]|uniref:cell number regulator 8-like n=1 Tax=Salvia splendens TaxID=180675 RepID=UPI001C25C977|nr:cell number regulator 8-like [Salvia splendens]
MANSDESNPLLPNQEEIEMANEKKYGVPVGKNVGAPLPAAIPVGWTTDGLPVSESMMERTHWDSGLFSCLGRNDQFCSSDLEVCILGSVAPCVLYGSNVERLGSSPATFANHCLPYTGLYLMGNTIFGWNCLAPWFSYSIRTAICGKFNLEGSSEALARSRGCCGSLVEDEVRREQCETACDFATHVFCHPCALCQEGREIRRRLPHPGFNAQPVLVMIPPGEQTIGRRV